MQYERQNSQVARAAILPKYFGLNNPDSPPLSNSPTQLLTLAKPPRLLPARLGSSGGWRLAVRRKRPWFAPCSRLNTRGCPSRTSRPLASYPFLSFCPFLNRLFFKIETLLDSVLLLLSCGDLSPEIRDSPPFGLGGDGAFLLLKVPGGRGGMGPFNEYHKDQKVREKRSPRSRIPRLVLRPYSHIQKGSPSSESPLSEEESRDYDLSSGQSRRSTTTVSSISFCSDDTGCPSSQSVSPVKSPSKLASILLTIPTVNEEESGRKVHSGTVTDWNIQHIRHKREQKSCLVQPGSEADFSSSSSTGSISAPEGLMSSSGSKRSSASRSRGVHGRSSTSSGHKQSGSPTLTREKDPVSAVYKSTANIRDVYGASSRSSSSNSGSYKGSDSSPTIRESEVADLKSQLARMREDWIEEECHRVEAQLALKEARKEIKQLREVIDTMKNSLVEKDKGVQKYFVDINIQNKKLESLLQSMELAQNGASRDDSSLDCMCPSPVKSLARSTTYTKMADAMGLEDQAVEEMADSGLLANDDMASRTDLFDQLLKSKPTDSSSGDGNWAQANEMQAILANSAAFEISPPSIIFMTNDNRLVREQAIQTDVVPYSPDVQSLILHILKSQHNSPISPISSTWVSDIGQAVCASEFETKATDTLMDLTPNNPNTTILVSRLESVNHFKSPQAHTCNEQAQYQPSMMEPTFTSAFDQTDSNEFSVSEDQPVCQRSYWSKHFIVDLLAVAAPVVPTLAWIFSTRRGGSGALYNIGALLRGCCLVALHSLRMQHTQCFPPHLKK
ncbi:syntabulin isoform X3 [Pristis pectinata]|uniref:syntabulin isoform X3 n=1 Tax=Pristis pectinata TaxID=685728 RepID=UPI00223CB65F|nr:syntabulin isoform X3 [Pristis pectinata]